MLKIPTINIDIKDLKDINILCTLIFSEDILKSDNAIWISPDGQKIVYATFNDSRVQSVQWKIYGDGRDANVNPYPKEAFMRYPKVCLAS